MLTQPPDTGQIRGEPVDEPKIDRATFLRQGWRRLLNSAAQGAGAALDLVDNQLSSSLLRPPGALPEAEFLLSCTRCNGCVEACPHGSIVKAPPQAGPAAGTPQILPANLPCYLCEDLPCIKACSDGALLPLASRRDVFVPHESAGSRDRSLGRVQQTTLSKVSITGSNNGPVPPR